MSEVAETLLPVGAKALEAALLDMLFLRPLTLGRSVEKSEALTLRFARRAHGSSQPSR